MPGVVRVVLRRDLGALGARLTEPAVRRITGEIREEAARLAPDGKRWITARDERVRPSHRDVHGDEIPGNVRYKLPKLAYVRRVGYVTVPGRYDPAWYPRDEDLPIEQVANCRCESAPRPGAVGASLQAGEVRVSGSRVRGEVYTRYPRAADSEFAQNASARWLGRAASAVAARLRARR